MSRKIPAPDGHPADDQQRAALALEAGHVYVAFGGHFGDCGPYIGSVAAVVMLGISFAISLWFLIAVPLIGYAFAWYAHFFVEGNKPATFGHPFYSLAADYRMLFLMMAGKMKEEVAKYVTPAAPPVPPV